jgi:GrpB-like predicted nucleotidyltransferase (UPF0157 family)
VEIIRFDREASMPATPPSADSWIAPLVRSDDATVAVVRVEERGRLLLPQTDRERLLGVLAGEGWADDGSETFVPLSAGRGGLWAAGERFDVRSEMGLTAAMVEGRFELRAFQVTRDIVVLDYDPNWPAWFERLGAHLRSVLGDDARIDHVGSTSVPGLAAKPIIDLDVVVSSDREVGAVIERLESIGYRWRGDLGVVGREAFASPNESGLPPHNLYVVVEDNRAHQDHWLLRDLLRSDAVSRERYAASKRANAESAERNMDAYVEAKADLLAELLTRARAERGLPAVEYWRPDPRT